MRRHDNRTHLDSLSGGRPCWGLGASRPGTECPDPTVKAGLGLSGLVIIAIGLFFYTLMNITNVAVMDLAGFIISMYGIGSAFFLAGRFLLLAGLVVAPLRLYRGSKVRRAWGV